MAAPDEKALRAEMCLWARSMFERGLTPGSSGNISVRLDDGTWLVTPTNASLGFLDPAALSKLDGQGRSLVPDGATVVNDPELAMRAALDGQGLAQLPAYQVSEALRDGTLVTCLEHLAPDDRGHYLCYLSRQQLPKRIRAFVDFMTTAIRALDLSGIELGMSCRQPPGRTDLAGAPA